MRIFFTCYTKIDAIKLAMDGVRMTERGWYLDRDFVVKPETCTWK